jgi:hypothetical protein
MVYLPTKINKKAQICDVYVIKITKRSDSRQVGKNLKRDDALMCKKGRGCQ